MLLCSWYCWVKVACACTLSVIMLDTTYWYCSTHVEGKSNFLLVTSNFLFCFSFFLLLLLSSQPLLVSPLGVSMRVDASTESLKRRWLCYLTRLVFSSYSFEKSAFEVVNVSFFRYLCPYQALFTNTFLLNLLISTSSSASSFSERPLCHSMKVLRHAVPSPLTSSY